MSEETTATEATVPATTTKEKPKKPTKFDLGATENDIVSYVPFVLNPAQRDTVAAVVRARNVGREKANHVGVADVLRSLFDLPAGLASIAEEAASAPEPGAKSGVGKLPDDPAEAVKVLEKRSKQGLERLAKIQAKIDAMKAAASDAPVEPASTDSDSDGATV